MPTDQIIIPALIPEDPQDLRDELQGMPWLYEVHIDIVDGQFVDSLSWPFEPAGEPEQIADILEQYSAEIDLMCLQPLPIAEVWAATGAERLVLHAETISVDDFVYLADRFPDVSIGVSMLNDTEWSVIEPFIPVADFIQLMGILVIGAQGAPFDERVLERIGAVTAADPAIPISVDGSVNAETIPRLRQAGVDRYVVGSALLRAEDREMQYQYLDSLARPQLSA